MLRQPGDVFPLFAVRSSCGDRQLPWPQKHALVPFWSRPQKRESARRTASRPVLAPIGRLGDVVGRRVDIAAPPARLDRHEVGRTVPIDVDEISGPVHASGHEIPIAGKRRETADVPAEQSARARIAIRDLELEEAIAVDVGKGQSAVFLVDAAEPPLVSGARLRLAVELYGRANVLKASMRVGGRDAYRGAYDQQDRTLDVPPHRCRSPVGGPPPSNRVLRGRTAAMEASALRCATGFHLGSSVAPLGSAGLESHRPRDLCRLSTALRPSAPTPLDLTVSPSAPQPIPTSLTRVGVAQSWR